VDEVTLNAELVSVRQCQEKYQKSGTFRRLCCSSACHPYDILCYGECVHGEAERD
jgi:hypothetical protein